MLNPSYDLMTFGTVSCLCSKLSSSLVGLHGDAVDAEIVVWRPLGNEVENRARPNGKWAKTVPRTVRGPDGLSKIRVILQADCLIISNNNNFP